MSTDTGARMSYAAALVGCVTYGALLVLSKDSVSYVLIQRTFGHNSGIYALLAFNTFERLIYARERWTLSRKVLLAYTILLFVSETIYFIAACKWSAIEFVDAEVDPAIFAGELSSKIALLKDTMYTVTIWIADSFIVSAFPFVLVLSLISDLYIMKCSCIGHSSLEDVIWFLFLCSHILPPSVSPHIL